MSTLHEDFLKLKFGMFIHFNMLTYMDRRPERGYPDPGFFSPRVAAVNKDAVVGADYVVHAIPVGGYRHVL